MCKKYASWARYVEAPLSSRLEKRLRCRLREPSLVRMKPSSTCTKPSSQLFSKALLHMWATLVQYIMKKGVIHATRYAHPTYIRVYRVTIRQSVAGKIFH